MALQRTCSHWELLCPSGPGSHSNHLTQPRRQVAFLPCSVPGPAFWIQSPQLILPNFSPSASPKTQFLLYKFMVFLLRTMLTDQAPPSSPRMTTSPLFLYKQERCLTKRTDGLRATPPVTLEEETYVLLEGKSQGILGIVFMKE